MADIYLGQLVQKTAQSGNTYFKGFIGKVPVVGFFGKNDATKINIKLDAGMVAYIDEKEDDDAPAKPAPQPAAEPDDLPF